MRRRRSPWSAVLAGGVVIAAGFGIALVEAYGLPKGAVWLVVAAAVLLLVVIRLAGARRG